MITETKNNLDNINWGRQPEQPHCEGVPLVDINFEHDQQVGDQSSFDELEYQYTYTAAYELADGRIVEMPGPTGEGWVQEEIDSTKFHGFYDDIVNHENGVCWWREMSRLIDDPASRCLASYKWTRQLKPRPTWLEGPYAAEREDSYRRCPSHRVKRESE